MPYRPALAFVILAGAAVPALAQERPSMTPTRDVAITYHMLSQRPGDLHMSIQASTGLARVQGPNQRGYAIIDRKGKQMTLVMSEKQIYMVMPIPAGQQRSPELDTTARFMRHGTDTVAGLTCTVWDYAGEHATGTACITDDGVMLRVQDGATKHGMEAAEVRYAPQPDADFQPPPGFTKQDVPPMPAGAPPAR